MSMPARLAAGLLAPERVGVLAEARLRQHVVQ